MARSESKIRESVVDIEMMITEGVYRDKFVRVRTKAFAEEVNRYWKELAQREFEEPRGGYVDSVHVERHPEGAFKRLPQFWVGTRYWKAHFIEYGTGPDTKGVSPRHLQSWQRGGRAPLTVTKQTPTPEFGFATRTALAFGGTPDTGASDAANLEV